MAVLSAVLPSRLILHRPQNPLAVSPSFPKTLLVPLPSFSRHRRAQREASPLGLASSRFHFFSPVQAIWKTMGWTPPPPWPRGGGNSSPPRQSSPKTGRSCSSAPAIPSRSTVPPPACWCFLPSLLSLSRSLSLYHSASRGGRKMDGIFCLRHSANCTSFFFSFFLWGLSIVQVTELEGHTALVTSVVMVPMGHPAMRFSSFCWTSSLDGTICYWDYSLPELIRRVEVRLPIYCMVSTAFPPSFYYHRFFSFTWQSHGTGNV